MGNDIAKRDEGDKLQAPGGGVPLLSNQMMEFTRQLMVMTEKGPGRFIVGVGATLLFFGMSLKVISGMWGISFVPVEFIATLTVAALILGVGAFFAEKNKKEVANTGQRAVAKMGLLNAKTNQTNDDEEEKDRYQPA